MYILHLYNANIRKIMTQILYKPRRPKIKFKWHEIKYYDTPLYVKGTYSKGDPQTRDYPGSPDEFDMHEAWCGEYDIMPLLDEQRLDEIEQLIIEKHY